MENFWLQLLGTNDYEKVVVGFIFALLGASFNYVFSEKKLSWSVLGKNVLAIIIGMRFSKLIIDLIPMNGIDKADLVAYVGLLVGLLCEVIPQYFMKKIASIKKLLMKSSTDHVNR